MELPPPPPPPPPLPFEWAMNLISHWKSEPAELGFISNLDRSKTYRYLQAIDVILLQSTTVPDCRIQAEEAMGMAVARLKHEFLHILKRVTAAQDEDENTRTNSMALSSVSSTSLSTVSFIENDRETSAPILDAIDDLQNIAERMNSAGHLAEFTDIYTSVRNSFFLTQLRRFGIRKLSTSDTRGLVFDEFNTHIRTWIRASTLFYSILFPKEQNLSAQIFDGLFGDACFSNTVQDAKIELLNFAEALINTRRAPEKLFKLLDLYYHLEEICPALTFMTFSEEPVTQGESEPILGLCFQLVVAVRETLLELENTLVNEVSTVGKEAKGSIHSLIRYVMHYISLTVDYHDILSKFIVSNPATSFRDLMIPDVKFAEREGQTPLARHLVLIVVVLCFKLEAKSKKYEDDASLVHLFMTNNLHCIVQEIERSPKLRGMIGEEYMNNLRTNILKQASSYLKSTCERMLHCLRNDEPHQLSKFIFSGVSTATLTKRIKKFNTLFEGVRSTQARWVVPDWVLRKDLRISIAENLVPAYKSFLERYKSRVEKRKQTYIKYSVEELQALIYEDFFAT